MGKFNVSVMALGANNTAGMQLNVQVDAPDSVAALDVAKAELQRTIAEAGLTIRSTPPAAPAV